MNCCSCSCISCINSNVTFNDLEELEDILYSIDVEDDYDTPYNFTEEEECDIIECIMQLMYDFIDDNPCEISEPDFHYNIIDSVKDLFYIQIKEGFLNNLIIIDEDNDGDDIEKLFDIASELFFSQIIPCRSFSNTFILNTKNNEKIEYLKNKLEYLSSKPQPTQRTLEWYTFRHNLITASNAYKAFENQSTQNQLIYEKCKPMIVNVDEPKKSVNVDTTLHWGQKYEPVSLMIYENNYKTQVGDFGCIQHEKHKFLGASPDGINNNPEIPDRFGRMLEIKNIINRDIDGIPKKEYWIQMQLQMETCDLDECDFLETRFIEYENEKAFLDDGDSFTLTARRYRESRMSCLVYVDLVYQYLSIWELCHVGYVWICMDMNGYVDMSWISVMDTWIHGYPVSLPGSTYPKKQYTYPNQVIHEISMRYP